jgi:hypothetical protein
LTSCRSHTWPIKQLASSLPYSQQQITGLIPDPGELRILVPCFLNIQFNTCHFLLDLPTCLFAVAVSTNHFSALPMWHVVLLRSVSCILHTHLSFSKAIQTIPGGLLYVYLTPLVFHKTSRYCCLGQQSLLIVSSVRNTKILCVGKVQRILMLQAGGSYSYHFLLKAY